MKDYRDAVEALGALLSRRAVHNKLNRIMAHTPDAGLANLVGDVLRAFHSTQTNSLSIPVREMAACRESSANLLAYCKQRLRPRSAPPEEVRRQHP